MVSALRLVPPMHLKTLVLRPHPPCQTPDLPLSYPPPTLSIQRYLRHSPTPSTLRRSPFAVRLRRNRLFFAACISPGQEIFSEKSELGTENGSAAASSSSSEEAGGVSEVDAARREGFVANEGIWSQIKEIVMFAGPAAALWLCGPTMSLIDTVVVGQGSSIELAALGPGTVFCDYLGYIFMFLSIGTSNMVATSLAREDQSQVQHQISMLLFVGFSCGALMLIFTKLLGAWALSAFIGAKNLHIVPAANIYIQIRGIAWPAVLVGLVAQSASLGMKDSWGPLKALAVASAVNGVGDVFLCTFLGYGIAGAAWATMVSQVVAAYMMVDTLNKKGYNTFPVSIPSTTELLHIFKLAAPVFVTMVSKVAFYALIIYFATSMGTHSVAAHQVMVQIYTMCTVWGEPLSQTAQSFMPELMYGVNRNLLKARRLLRSLVMIGAMSGLILGAIGTSIPWLFPNIFTPDRAVINEMHKVLIPYFLALVVTPSTHSFEGTLLAGRDLKFLSFSMSGCFCLGGLLLLLLTNSGYGLPGCWCALVGFQWARFTISLWRLVSPDGVLYSEDLIKSFQEQGKVRAA